MTNPPTGAELSLWIADLTSCLPFSTEVKEINDAAIITIAPDRNIIFDFIALFLCSYFATGSMGPPPLLYSAFGATSSSVQAVNAILDANDNRTM
jgi:hypothetical protein